MEKIHKMFRQKPGLNQNSNNASKQLTKSIFDTKDIQSILFNLLSLLFARYETSCQNVDRNWKQIQGEARLFHIFTEYSIFM